MHQQCRTLREKCTVVCGSKGLAGDRWNTRDKQSKTSWAVAKPIRVVRTDMRLLVTPGLRVRCVQPPFLLCRRASVSRLWCCSAAISFLRAATIASVSASCAVQQHFHHCLLPPLMLSRSSISPRGFSASLRSYVCALLAASAQHSFLTSSPIPPGSVSCRTSLFSQ